MPDATTSSPFGVAPGWADLGFHPLFEPGVLAHSDGDDVAGRVRLDTVPVPPQPPASGFGLTEPDGLMWANLALTGYRLVRERL